MGFAQALNPSYENTRRGAPSAGSRARCRRRGVADAPLASFPIHISNSAVFFVPAARCCARVCLPFLFSASDPQPEGRRSAGRRYPHSVALVRRDTTFARRGRPGQTGTGLAALRPGDFGPAPRSPSPQLPAAPLRGRPSLPGVAPGRPKVPNLPGTVYEPRPGRHIPLRLQDRLRTTPLDERG